MPYGDDLFPKGLFQSYKEKVESGEEKPKAAITVEVKGEEDLDEEERDMIKELLQKNMQDRLERSKAFQSRADELNKKFFG
jgi:hypothetical protein